MTQNVDDLLARAGALDVIHLHGELENLLCTECDDTFPPDTALDRHQACPFCGALSTVKPAIILFGEAAPAYSLLETMRLELQLQDVVVVIGTSFNVIPADQFLPPSRLVTRERSFLIDLTPASRLDECFRSVAESATVGLPLIDDLITGYMNG